MGVCFGATAGISRIVVAQSGTWSGILGAVRADGGALSARFARTISVSVVFGRRRFVVMEPFFCLARRRSSTPFATTLTLREVRGQVLTPRASSAKSGA
jgi:hypothetical protein